MTETAPTIVNAEGQHPVVLVCEHASAFIPASLNNLGIDAAAASSHIAWDPGAVEVARHLSRSLDAVLIEANVSRLVYDCNRPPEAPDAMPARSEIYTIPGNADLSSLQRQQRVDQYYRPFERLVRDTLSAHAVPPVLVTVHSFTPVYNGVARDLEVGILHNRDARLADAILRVAKELDVQRNQPYGPDDGVMHTLKLHAEPSGFLNVMIEVRNDLIASASACEAMAVHLQRWLVDAMSVLAADAAAANSGSVCQ